jgi:methionine aminopeptidase
MCVGVIGAVMNLIAPGKKALELAETGDKMILKEVEAKHKKSKVEKGIAFPTCISINNCVGHYSPLSGDATVIQEGDLVKVYVHSYPDIYIYL